MSICTIAVCPELVRKHRKVPFGMLFEPGLPSIGLLDSCPPFCIFRQSWKPGSVVAPKMPTIAAGAGTSVRVGSTTFQQKSALGEVPSTGPPPSRS